MRLPDLPSSGNAVVPMDDRGEEIDEGAFRAMLRYMADGGTNVFVGGPHATEFVNMSRVERHRLWEVAVDELKGTAQVSAIPFGPASTTEMVSMFAMAKDMGFDAAQLYPGAQEGWGNDGLFVAEAERYFRDVLDAVDLPMYLCSYHGGEIIDTPDHRFPVDRVVALVEEYPHVVGVTASGDDAASVRSLLGALAGRRRVRLTGGEACFEMLELGVYGFHSIQPCFAPRLCSGMLAAYHAGDRAQAEALSAVVADLCRIVHTARYHYPRSIKPILAGLGFGTGSIRRPYLPPPPDVQAEMAARVAALDLGRFEDLPARR